MAEVCVCVCVCVFGDTKQDSFVYSILQVMKFEDFKEHGSESEAKVCEPPAVLCY